MIVNIRRQQDLCFSADVLRIAKFRDKCKKNFQSTQMDRLTGIEKRSGNIEPQNKEPQNIEVNNMALFSLHFCCSKFLVRYSIFSFSVAARPR